MKNIISEIIRFVKFGMVGLINTGISLIIYYAFVFYDERLYLVGNVIGWFVSVANSYFLNRRFVFKSEDTCLKEQFLQLLKTYVTYFVTLVIGTGLLAVEVQYFNIPSKICPIINLFISVPINYVMIKFWTFTKKGNKK